jgi:hypothetical protein
MLSNKSERQIISAVGIGWGAMTILAPVYMIHKLSTPSIIAEHVSKAKGLRTAIVIMGTMSISNGINHMRKAYNIYNTTSQP